MWELGGHGDTVRIQFAAIAGGQPGAYTVLASASGSSTGSTQSQGLAIQLLSAPELSASMSVTPNQAQPGQDVTYTVSVLNQGTGVASGVDVLVTLPPVFSYAGDNQISGDFSRSGGTDPVAGTELPYFDGFDIPPRSGSTPGQLILRFQAQVLPDAGALGHLPGRPSGPLQQRPLQGRAGRHRTGAGERHLTGPGSWTSPAQALGWLVTSRSRSWRQWQSAISRRVTRWHRPTPVGRG